MGENRQGGWLKHADFMLIDLACLHVAFVAAYFLRFGFGTIPYAVPEYRSLVLILSLIQIGGSIAAGNLNHVLRRGKADELWSVAVLTALTLALAALYMYAAHNGTDYSRLQVFYTVGVFFVLDYFLRCWHKAAAVRRLRKNPAARRTRSVLVLSDGANVGDIVADLQADVYDHFEIRAVTLVDSGKAPEGLRQIDTVDEALSFICREWVDEVVICLPAQSAAPTAFVDACAEMGVAVHSVLPLATTGRNVQYVDEVGGRTVLTVSLNHVSPAQAFVKRAVDIVGGLVGSLLAVVIGIVIAPFILVKSPGPLLFKQERIGKNGKKFKLLKFRSMVPDAEAQKKDLAAENRVADGMMFKLDFDPRIIGNRVTADGKQKTGIGEFIRKTSLDEFPQFFNVLKGEMSLVGTRPPTPDEWEKYAFRHRARLAQKPGITGLWQVSGRSDITDFEEVVRLDTEYIANFKLSLDAKILLKTLVVLFRRTGAR